MQVDGSMAPASVGHYPQGTAASFLDEVSGISQDRCSRIEESRKRLQGSVKVSKSVIHWSESVLKYGADKVSER